jgi:geranylgeranyl pyrophosphate synthase
MMVNQSFQAWIAESSLRVHEGLVTYLEKTRYPATKLQEAMCYATLSGGKRIRPLLIYATGKIFDAPLENCDLAAIAVELVHSYSLVHDDLPAMDNAPLRRGKLSCFKAFGEDLAILAGDALLTLAFEVLASHAAPLSTEARLQMVQILSRASGPSGMVSGQTLDIANTAQTPFSEKPLVQLYQLKTGALIEACISLGLAAAPATNLKQKKALEKYAENISLAFQIQDDLLDIEGIKEDLGKPTGLDEAHEKVTYPRLVGLENAKRRVETLFQQAFEALEPLGPETDFLRQLTEYVGKRDR